MPDRKIYILRHAEAGWPAGADDFQRPLSKQGEADAQQIVATLTDENIDLDYVLSSSARRTRETLKPILTAWPELDVKYREDLYLASAGKLYEVLKALPAEVNNVLFVGHNPGLHGFLSFLVGSAEHGLAARVAGDYPTATLSEIKLTAENWADIQAGDGHLSALYRGKGFASN